MSKRSLYILIVSLNSGERLKQTLDSIFGQKFTDVTICIKDGGSSDGSLENLISQGYFEGRDNVKIEVSPDKGIYDGMNQAVGMMQSLMEDDSYGYCIFMNCGDTFRDDEVLLKAQEYLKQYDNPRIVYGDQYNLIQKSVVSSAPEINDFTLFRNVPCHQVCFIDVRLFEDRAYKTEYTVRADYEHFLYSVYEKHADCEHIPVVICNYEGGGFSETKENRKKSAKQHRIITDIYMPKKAAKYRAIMILTLAPLRTALAESDRFSGMYNLVKSFIYRKK